MTTDPWHPRLLSTGTRLLGALGPLVDVADPHTTVSGRSRMLCAALAELALATYEGLGGGRAAHRVGRAASMLSLLTKIDDQVIDSMAFHGGVDTDRTEVRRRTRAYLAPSLDSIVSGVAVNGEGRCALAAALGRELRALCSGGERLERLLALIARGWEIQVDAVAILTAHPATVSHDEMLEVTANISGAWLMMIAMVGTLPEDAARMLHPDEEEAFYRWGQHIQRADAFSDLPKDLEQGLVSSFPVHRLWSADPQAHRALVMPGLAREVVGELIRRNIDLDGIPDRRALRGLHQRMAGLGGLPSLLDWILGFLTWRYLLATDGARTVGHPAFSFSLHGPETWGAYVGSASRAAQASEVRCSAP